MDNTDVADQPSTPLLASQLPPEILQALTPLDDQLVAVLASGDIRLVSSEWLAQQPPEFKMPMRQELERWEQEGASPSPLLSPDEATALIREGNRSVGVLSYPWLSPGDPDPAGVRVKVLRRALAEHSHIRAFFWE